MTDLFYPNGKRPPRRFFRREFEREVAKCEHWLTNVINEFVEALFDDNYYHTYAELYNWYLERFNSLVKYVNHRYKLSYCEVNQNYFIENFKPIENGK
jgi:hypothetical protein